MLISEFLHNMTNKALEDLLKAKGIDTNNSPEFIIEKPKNSDFGDFATSLPLQLSKLLSKFLIKLIQIGSLPTSFVNIAILN